MSTAAIDYEAREVSRTQARIDKWVRKETRGFGDTTEALRRICREANLPFWTMYRILQGKAKTVTSGMQERIRDAYVAYCEKQLGLAIQELRIEKAVHPDADYTDIDDEIADLRKKVSALRKQRTEG